MITSDQQNTYIIQSIISVGGPVNSPSFTGVISGLNKIDARLVPFIEDNIDEILDEFYTAKVNLAIEIGVQKPAERRIVIETIVRVISANKNLKNMQLLASINQELSKINISYRILVSLAANLESIAQKSLGIIQGIVSLKLFSKKPLVEEVEAFIGKYMPRQSSSLTPLIDMLGLTLTNMGDNSSDLEIIQKSAIDTLLKIGYLKVGVEGKDPGQLANILFYEMVAAQGCLNAKTKKGQESVSKDEVVDQIAIILVNALR
jgi:hypothetical protein